MAIQERISSHKRGYEEAFVRDILEQLGQADAVGLLPPHFISVTLPKIGGQIVTLQNLQQETVAYGFSLPTRTVTGEIQYIIRGHSLSSTQLPPTLSSDWQDVRTISEQPFAGSDIKQFDQFTIRTPDREQALQATQLQRKIWGDNAPVYPADLYGPDTGTGTRLVAIDSTGMVVAFLLGFYGYNRQNLWIESQLLAVDPAFQKSDLASTLKWTQYEQAQHNHVGQIHWTADPLQAKNAGLNYNRLGAMTTEFTRDYYPFRNDQNQVVASRFGISWNVGSRRAELAKLGQLPKPDYQRIVTEQKVEVIRPLSLGNGDNWRPPQEPKILLIEIPKNWTQLQQTDIQRAREWRTITDRIFQNIIGTGRGKYIISGRTYDGEGRPFLIAEPI